MPTADNTVEIVVPKIRVLFSSIPAANANFGFPPAADMAIPDLDRKNNHTMKQQIKKNKISPVGTTISPAEVGILKVINSFRICLYRLLRSIVARSPFPIAQTISGLWNGRISQKMFINAIAEKPTYVETVISDPLMELSNRPYPIPMTMESRMPIPIATAKPAKPEKPDSILITPPNRPATMPSERPKFNPIPAWIPGTIARTKIPFIPKRTRTSLINDGTGISSKPPAINKAKKNRIIMIRGKPKEW